MKTFLVFSGAVTSDLAAITAASLTSRGAFLSRGDVVDMRLGPISVGGPIGGKARLGKRLWTEEYKGDTIKPCCLDLFYLYLLFWSEARKLGRVVVRLGRAGW